MGESPPTERVISILEFLAAADDPLNSAEIADGLALSRSTVGAILSALESRGWVRRLPDLTYQLGPAAVAMADKARGSGPVPDEQAMAEIEGLAARVGCGAALSLISATQMTFIAVTVGRGLVPAGITVGTRLALRAPVGASAIAFASPLIQQEWLRAASRQDRVPAFADILDLVRDRGVAVWGIDEGDIASLDILAEVVAHLDDRPASESLRERVLTMLNDISGHPYRAEELDSEVCLPVSYISAPVFGRNGKPVWELQIGPLRSAVPRDEREHYCEQVRVSAERLGMVSR